MLAARAAAPSACLVVDCGTALTLDRVSAEGEHEGGFILPGLALMRRSLEENTRIRLDSGYVPDSIELGNSTDAAVYHGTLAAAVALIQAQWSELNQASTPARLVLTGGGAGELSRQLQAQAAETVPDLVLDGLQYAIGLN
jgi:type III pantothenate kinase